MAWGELIPIRSRIVYDVLAIALQLYSMVAPAENAKEQAIWLVLPFFLTILTSGSLTNRWTLTLPMIPFVVFEGLAIYYWKSKEHWFHFAGRRMGSILFFLLGIALSVLFPPVQLPTVQGKYNVGVVDLHLPVEINGESGHVSARLLYPTNDEEESSQGSIPYLDPKTALEFCAETMKLGAPGPLKPLSFMLHNYRLISLKAKRNAIPIGDKKLPICVYSHGLGGTFQIYSYQALSLAASGKLVLMMDHTDGSAPVVQLQNGSIMKRNAEIVKLWEQGKEVEYVRARRAFTDLRVDEFLAATEALRNLNTVNIPELESLGVGFYNKLLVNKISFMGHSFGGATAITAAHRRSNLPTSVVAHEPAVDWIPDDARLALFSNDKLQDSTHCYNGGTGGYQLDQEEEKKDSNGTCDESDKKSVHDIDLLFLYSDEWAKKNWGCSHIVQCMHRRGELGRPGGVSDYGVIVDSCHTEFSDTCMLTPTWLARGVGMTGTRNPVDTAQEIASRTLAFLESVEQTLQ